eukprot:SAG31_NODE_1433_length_8368_cov_8.437901_3_plen_291_part_00
MIILWLRQTFQDYVNILQLQGEMAGLMPLTHGDLDDLVPLASIGQFAEAWAKAADPWFALLLNDHESAGVAELEQRISGLEEQKTAAAHAERYDEAAAFKRQIADLSLILQQRRSADVQWPMQQSYAKLMEVTSAGLTEQLPEDRLPVTDRVKIDHDNSSHEQQKQEPANFSGSKAALEPAHSTAIPPLPIGARVPPLHLSSLHAGGEQQKPELKVPRLQMKPAASQSSNSIRGGGMQLKIPPLTLGVTVAELESRRQETASVACDDFGISTDADELELIPRLKLGRNDP